MDTNAVTALVKMLDALRLATLATIGPDQAICEDERRSRDLALEAYEALGRVTGPSHVKMSKAPPLKSVGDTVSEPYPITRVPGLPTPPPQDIDPSRGIRPH